MAKQRASAAKTFVSIAQPRDPNVSGIYFPAEHLNALTVRVGLESLLRQVEKIGIADADRAVTQISYDAVTRRLVIQWARHGVDGGA
ncbi:hypothetical protein KQR54_18880 [Mycobacterium gordonae]|nr:hypothetical protein [Mycobacterium gordonae]